MHALSHLLPHRIDVLHRGGSRPDGTTLPPADVSDPRGAGRASGSVRAWGDRANVTVDDPTALGAALRLTRHHLRAAARACDRTDPTAEVHLLPAADGEPVAVSALLLRHVRAALETAAATDGLVDPTAPARRTGSGRGGPALPVCGRLTARRPAADWRAVRLTDRSVQVPGGTPLDLTASALPLALDDLAVVLGSLTGTGVRLVLRGRASGCDRTGRRTGAAVTDGRRVVDPRTGRPLGAGGTWAGVHVVAGTARTASALAVAAVLRGAEAPAWLADRAPAARLRSADGDVLVVGDPALLAASPLREVGEPWPSDPPAAPTSGATPVRAA